MQAHLVLTLTLLAAAAAPAQVPTRDNNPELQRMAGCAHDGKELVCSKSDVQRALSLTSTIRVDAAPPNHSTLDALTGLVHHLGKEVATPDQPAGLLITLEPTLSSGVNMGPNSGSNVARLRVLIVDHSGGPDKLLWVENYMGDPSKPWPLLARAAVTQFEQTLAAR